MHHEMKVVPTRLVFGRGCCALGALVLVAATAGGAPGRGVVGPGFSPEETAARAKETHERRSRSVRRQFRSHRSRIARPRPRGESARLSRGRAGLLFGKRTASKLSLTEEERTRLREAFREIRQGRRESRSRIAEARLSLRRAYQDPERPAQDIRALAENLGQARATALLRRRADRERISGILTEDHRERLAELRTERRERRRSKNRPGSPRRR